MLASQPVLQPDDDTSWQRFSIDYAYPVAFTEDLFSTDNPTLHQTVTRAEPQKQHRLSVFVDAGVVEACPQLIHQLTAYCQHHSKHLSLVSSPIILPAGEAIKSSAKMLLQVQKAVGQQRLDRHSYILGIGGGALLDAVGLVAATSHRGIRHIRIPTTVLGQNDSGVGVKNGVNLFGQKNYLGTFAPPYAVLNDYHFIAALPARDKIAGMAEAVKVALIRDAEFYEWLEESSQALAAFDKSAMQYMIKRCAQLHMQQIANGGDPFETGSARPLDFGHWAAHRLESMTGHAVRHGEAVAIGIALDTRYSVLSGLLHEGDERRVCTLLKRLGFKLWHPVLAERHDNGSLKIVQGLTDFQEHLGGELTITLLQALGAGIEVHHMDTVLVEQSLMWLQQLADSSSLKPVQVDSLSAANAHYHTSTAEKGRDRDTDRATDSLNTQAAATHLQQWLSTRLDSAQQAWLQERLHRLTTAWSERDMHITLGLIPRKLGRDDLQLTNDDINAARQETGRDWNPSDWTVDTAARCLVILTLRHDRADDFDRLFSDLCRGAELKESIAFYRCTAVLPHSDAMTTLMGAGLRTHIRAIFEAIAHNNPYPQLHFDQQRWNHMVLKALFIDSTLWQIQGFDARSNPELAEVLCDYAHERWAAGRVVTPELWRAVGPYASGKLLDDLLRAQTSNDIGQPQAAILALLQNPQTDHQALRQSYAAITRDIDNGVISWESLGRDV